MELPIFETLHQAHSLHSPHLLSQHVAVEEFAWRPRSPFSLVCDISTGDANIVVAVTDNAIQVNHPDLVNKIVAGRDVVDNDNDPSPCGGNDGFHGSHVSGTVGAETNNNQL